MGCIKTYQNHPRMAGVFLGFPTSIFLNSRWHSTNMWSTWAKNGDIPSQRLPCLKHLHGRFWSAQIPVSIACSLLGAAVVSNDLKSLTHPGPKHRAHVEASRKMSLRPDKSSCFNTWAKTSIREIVQQLDYHMGYFGEHFRGPVIDKIATYPTSVCVFFPPPVGSFKHFLFSTIYGIVLPSWLIFFRGVGIPPITSDIDLGMWRIKHHKTWFCSF